jgi:regulator of replication initiation timing
MSALLLERNPLAEQVRSLTALVERLQQEVCELRRENGELRQEVRDLRREAGSWKRMHAGALERNAKLQAELDQARAEIRQLQAERFGKQSEKQSSTDRSNDLEAPQQQATPKKKRGQQPGRPAPQRRDYSHLPEREEQIDLPDEAKVCACCGKPLADLGYSDDSEQIEMEITVYRRVVRRKRYRRTCDCGEPPRTVTAPLPPKLLPKSIYGTSLWVHLLREKFHLQRPMPTMRRTVPDHRTASAAGIAPRGGNDSPTDCSESNRCSHRCTTRFGLVTCSRPTFQPTTSFASRAAKYL